MIIEKIRKRIKSSDKTMRQISEKTGVDKAALCRIKNGGSCKVETADKLLKYFGLKLVQTKKAKKEGKKMSERFYFRKGCDIDRVRELCKHPIQQRRGKMVCEQILRELNSGYLIEKTKKWLSKWVNPARREPKVEDTFQAICKELFGHRIARDDDC